MEITIFESNVCDYVIINPVYKRNWETNPETKNQTNNKRTNNKDKSSSKKWKKRIRWPWPLVAILMRIHRPCKIGLNKLLDTIYRKGKHTYNILYYIRLLTIAAPFHFHISFFQWKIIISYFYSCHEQYHSVENVCFEFLLFCPLTRFNLQISSLWKRLNLNHSLHSGDGIDDSLLFSFSFFSVVAFPIGYLIHI